MKRSTLTAQATAFALAALVTLSLMTGLNGLAQAEHAASPMAQADAEQCA